MKFLVKLLLVIFILGLVLATAGFFAGMNIEELQTFFVDDESYGEQIVFTIDDELDTLIIDASTRHIHLIVTSDEVMTIKYYKHEKDTFTFPDSALGTYKLVQKEKFNFFSFVLFKTVSKDRLTIEIEMPETWLLDLNLSTNVGEIKLDHESVITHKNLILDSDTGSIYVKNVNIESFSGDVDTGAITLINASIIENVFAKSSTGKVTLNTVTAANYDLQTSTGSIEISNITGSDLDADVSTGRITASNLNLTGDLALNTSTGDIILSQFVADSIKLSTSTGEMKVTVQSLSLYNFDLKTSTGKVYVDGDNQGTRHTSSSGTVDLDAIASTGDIRIIVQG
jgi:DUF4097 and DUF4098 domain-containing protein YvlB